MRVHFRNENILFLMDMTLFICIHITFEREMFIRNEGSILWPNFKIYVAPLSSLVFTVGSNLLMGDKIIHIYSTLLEV